MVNRGIIITYLYGRFILSTRILVITSENEVQLTLCDKGRADKER